MSRRMAKVAISHELFVDWVTEGAEHRGFRCVQGLPEGAKFIGSHYQELTAYLVFEHESFEDTPPNRMLPFVDVVFEELPECPVEE